MRILLLFTFLIPCYLFGQTICTGESQHRLDSVLQVLSQTDYSQMPISEVLVSIGKVFLNAPYVEKTLEIPGDEPLVIDFMGLDCTTYIETVVTLARLAKKKQFTFEDYQQKLEYLRYRDGKRDHYPSRLHYFSDWIFNNQKKDILKDITESIGGEIYENNPSFMSSNPKYYPQLSNKDYVAQIKEKELEIKERTYYYLPKEVVAEHEKRIKSGDLIAFTIDMNTLDISHVGFAIEQNGRIHLIHASSDSKKVEISKAPLGDYLIGNKKQSGIMVCRFIDPQ